MLEPVPEGERLLLCVVDCDGLEVVDQAGPVVFVAGLQIDLHDPQPLKEAPGAVLRRTWPFVPDVAEHVGDHVDELVEAGPCLELPGGPDELHEVVRARLAAGDVGELGNLLRVRLPPGHGDREAAIDEWVRAPLGGQVCSDQGLHQLGGLDVASDEVWRTTNGDVEADRFGAVRTPRRNHKIIHAGRRGLLERHSLGRPLIQLEDRSGGEEPAQQDGPQLVLESRAASTRRVWARRIRRLPGFVRHCVSLPPGGKGLRVHS